MKIETKKDFAKATFSMILVGGLLFTIGIPLSFFIIGIPLVIGGIALIIVGFVGLIISPVFDPSKANKLTSWNAWKKTS